MRKLLLLLLIPTVLYCNGKPKIEFEKLAHEFGKQAQNTELKCIFAFKNVGDGLLRIDKIEAGWGCTGVLLSKKEIPAGGSGQIEVTLKTGSHKGKISKSVTVYSNDPMMGSIRLILNADVQ
jgi:hypothetical protein